MLQIYAEASLVFPLLVGETFAQHYYTKMSAQKSVLRYMNSDVESDVENLDSYMNNLDVDPKELNSD